MDWLSHSKRAIKYGTVSMASFIIGSIIGVILLGSSNNFFLVFGMVSQIIGLFATARFGRGLDDLLMIILAYFFSGFLAMYGIILYVLVKIEKLVKKQRKN